MRPSTFASVGGGGSNPSSNPGVKPIPPSAYFEPAKKGEVNELRTYDNISKYIMLKIYFRMLKNSLNDKDQNRRKEVVKKVIAFMTLGIPAF